MTQSNEYVTNGGNDAALPPNVAPWQNVLNVAIGALRRIGADVQDGISALERLHGPPWPSLPAAPVSTANSVAPAEAGGVGARPGGMEVSQKRELAALARAVTPDIAERLRLWIQALPDAPAVDFAAARRLANNVTVQAFWWGFHFRIPHEVMATWEGAGATGGGVAGGVAAILPLISGAGPAAPFVGAAAAYIAVEFGIMQAIDKGHGCFLSMTWLAPGVFVPTTMSARD